jgi:hypothetical protein
MPVSDASFAWPQALAAFAVVALVAFLITWIVTDLLHVRRTPYVGILAVVVAALAAGYLAWSGTSARDLVVDGWPWGILAGLVVGFGLRPLVRRLPATEAVARRPSPARYAWEGLVYGSAEGLLLSTLPVLAVWQTMADAGWSRGTGRVAATGALAVAGALVVILVHHLGYAEFRVPSARRELAGALFACGLQAAAFAITGNVLAPVVAHVILHAQLLGGHVQMPPEDVARHPLAHLAGSERVHERSRTRRDRVAR